MSDGPSHPWPRNEIDAAYAAYDEHPLDEADEWGDLESFHTAAGLSQVRRPSPD